MGETSATRSRASVSVALPGACGTISRIGLSGKSAAARPGIRQAATMMSNPRSTDAAMRLSRCRALTARSGKPNDRGDVRQSAAGEPAPDARDRLVHLVRAPCVAEADEMMAGERIEVDTRRGGDVGLLQH